MYSEKSGTSRIWKFERLNNYDRVTHFITERKGGISMPPYSSFNLSLKVGEDAGLVLKNRSILAADLGTTPDRFYFPDQRHTANIRELTSAEPAGELKETDALITAIPDIFICVTTADCIPIILYDPENHAAGIVHAGWRGIAASVVYATVIRMQTTYGSIPGNILACMGPSILWKNYEVGPEVITALEKSGGHKSEAIRTRSADGKGFVDLPEAAGDQLRKAGLAGSNIETSGICTFENNDRFYSARKEGIISGRFATGIMLRT